MADINLSMLLPNGESKKVAIPDDVPVRDLLPELVTALLLPTTGPDGRPVSYRLDSKALGRQLKEEETLLTAKVPADDRISLSPIVVAGAGRFTDRFPEEYPS